MNISDVLIPYGFIGFATIVLGIIQIMHFGEVIWGMGAVKIVGGFIIIIINLMLNNKSIFQSRQINSTVIHDE